MADLYWELDLNEPPGDDIDRQPARKRAKFDHNFSTIALLDDGCSSLDQYSSSHYIVNNRSTNSPDLAGSCMFLDSTWGLPGETARVWDNLLPITVDSMVPANTIYEWPSGSAEHRAPAQPSKMADDLAMDFSQSEFSCLDLDFQAERPTDNLYEDEENYEGANATLEDGQVAGAEQHQFVPEICFGMVRR